jgi:glucosamine kinase
MNRGLATSASGKPVVVVDLGGTWVRVVASGPGRRVFRAPTPGGAELPAVLDRLWRRWRLSRRDVVALGVASRGVWTAGERRALARRLRRFARRVVVISDVEAAYLGALGGTAGVLLLAGTGSIALGRDRRGRFTRAGGLGPLLGDEGSAFWIGREWLRATASEATRRRFATSPHAVRAVAALAPRVVARARRGQRGAARIVAAAQAHLASQAADVARVLRLPSPVVIGGAGSVMEDRWFAAGVRQALARAGVRAHWRESGGEPVDAAVRLAASLAARRR